MNPPEDFDELLTKTDLVDAIEGKIIRRREEREQTAGIVRGAFEAVLGEPHEEW